MKLYATVASERATKGQGGNDLLEIALQVELADGTRPTVANVNLYNDVLKKEYLLTVVPLDMVEDSGEQTTRRWRKQKGEKQKGEVCDECGQVHELDTL